MIPPAMQPPPGHVTNYQDPDRQMYIYSLVGNTLAISFTTVFVVLRFLARYRMSTKVQLDDVACLLGQIGFLGYSTICLLMLRYGGGLHQWNVQDYKLEGYNKCVYATMVIYGPTILAIKAAILLFLARVFSPYKTYVRVIYSFMGVMAVYYVVMMILKILICRPISMFWDKDVQGQCFNQRVLILTDNVISVVSDAIILLLPCPMTKSLNMKLKAKVKVAAVFGVGGLACIFSVVRLVFIVKEAQSEDQTYAFVQINLLGIAEGGIGVVCACFPLMPALWKSILHQDKPGYSSNSKSLFEMMPSASQKQYRSKDRASLSYRHDNDSDEKDLIHGKSYFTANVTANAEQSSTNDEDRSGKKGSFEDGHIMRTVEVLQYHDG